MAPTLNPGDLVTRVNRDVERSVLRARNGMRYVRGTHRPKLGVDAEGRRLAQRQGGAVALSNGTGVRYGPAGGDRAQPRQPQLHPRSAAGQQHRRVPRRTPASTSSCSTGASRTSSTPTTSLETYVDGYLPRALAAVRRETGRDEVTLAGYCLGGVIAALYAAGHEDARVRNLILMATPIDFGEMGAMVAAAARGPARSRRPHRRHRQRPGRRALQRLLHARADHGDRAEGDAARAPLERRVRRGLPGDGAVVARPRAVPGRGVPPARRAARPGERADERVDPRRVPRDRRSSGRAATCSSRWRERDNVVPAARDRARAGASSATPRGARRCGCPAAT